MPPSPRDPMLKKKRMDFVSQLDKSAFALIVYSYFLNPSMFILISRGITQTQISRPHESHPTSTLRTMTTLLLSNLFITTLYNIMFGPTGSETEVKGIFLDFVGQATPSTPLHLHTLSFLLFVLQSLCLLVAFESTPFLKPLPPATSTSVPSTSLLVPPPSPSRASTAPTTSPVISNPIPVPIPGRSTLRSTPLSPPPRPPPTLPTPEPEDPLEDAATPLETEEEEEEEEDFLSLFLPSRIRRRPVVRPTEDEEGVGLLDREEDGWGKEEEGGGLEEEEDEGGSIMVLRGVATLGRLLGFRWGIGGED